jgi:hypothetical protein
MRSVEDWYEYVYWCFMSEIELPLYDFMRHVCSCYGTRNGERIRYFCAEDNVPKKNNSITIYIFVVNSTGYIEVIIGYPYIPANCRMICGLSSNFPIGSDSGS